MQFRHSLKSVLVPQNRDLSAFVECERFDVDHPLISVITSTYNVAEHLPNAIRSIREQTYENVEWIIVDGGSDDGTLDIMRQNEDVIDCWISEPDKGIYDAWNKGIRHATGDWICFLGADDFLWGQDVLERIAPRLNAAYPAKRVVYGSLGVVNTRGELLYYLGKPWHTVRRRFQSVMTLPHPGLMHHRTLFEDHGDFDIAYRIAGDYEFLLRELKHREAIFVDIVIAGMSVGGISSNPDSSERMLLEMLHATRKHGRLFPGIPWLMAAVRHVFRKILWRTVGEVGARRLLDVGRKLLGKPAHWTRT